MSMTRETGEGGLLDAAVQRLDRALARLDVRLTGLLSNADSHNGGLFDEDRAKLAEALDAARGRERALAEAGVAASAALGLAISEIQAVLGDNDEAEIADADLAAEHAPAESEEA